MAAIHGPRQRASDGRWDYVYCPDEDGGVTALGYCGGWDAVPEELRAKFTGYELAFHADGHLDAVGAIACHAAYQLAHEVSFDIRSRQESCLVCRTRTSQRVRVGHAIPSFYMLCPGHSDMEIIARLYFGARVP